MWRTNEYSHAVAATVEDTTSAIANKKEIEKTGVDLGSPMPATARRGLSRRYDEFMTSFELKLCDILTVVVADCPISVCEHF